MRDDTRAITRWGLVFLAVTYLPTGLWAVLNPTGWYRDFPGGGRHWVSVDGPLNRHLVTDAGAGFLAIGVLLVLAAVWLDRRVTIAALVTVIVHAVPHFTYHALHPAAAYSSFDKVFGIGGIGFDAVVAAVLLFVVTRTRERRTVPVP